MNELGLMNGKNLKEPLGTSTSDKSQSQNVVILYDVCNVLATEALTLLGNRCDNFFKVAFCSRARASIINAFQKA